MSLKAPGLVSSRPKSLPSYKRRLSLLRLNSHALIMTWTDICSCNICIHHIPVDYNLVTNQTMNTQLRELELRLDAKISDIKYDMVKWIAGMMLAQAGVIAALVKLL